jgi:hypothetical protein
MAYKAFFIMIAALFLVACQQATRPVGDNNITGDYYLHKVDGIHLPGTVLHDGVAIEIRSGSFVIKANGTCISTTQFVAPDGKEVNRKVHATYVVQDSRLVMKWKGAGITEGTVEGDVFIMDNHGMIFEYRRKP